MGLESVSKDRLDDCIDFINSGGIAVMPTDTVYGVVCKAADQNAAERLYKLKSRENKPGTVIASSIDQLVELGIKKRYLKAVEQYWPGPISIEIPHGIDYLSQSTGRQAFRVVKDSSLQKILKKTGPLLTSSANMPGEPTSTDINEAKKYFGDEVGFYLDGGKVEAEPSTLIRVVDDIVEIIREGSVEVTESGRIKNKSED